MSSYMQQELLFFSRSFLSGVCLALGYDVLRIFRNLAPHGNLWLGIEDIVYGCASGLFLFSVIYRENDGMIRLYALLAAGLGILAFHAGPGKIFVKYLSAFLRKLGGWLGILGKPMGMCRKRLKFWLGGVRISLYEQKSIQKIRKRSHEKNRKKKKKQKKKHTEQNRDA